MTYPFASDPVPPGQGEPGEDTRGGVAWRDAQASGRVYEVVTVLADGVPEVQSRWGSLPAALAAADGERELLRRQRYTTFFVGVQDQDDPERGWLDWDDV